jgi:hypothetical protein
VKICVQMYHKHTPKFCTKRMLFVNAYKHGAGSVIFYRENLTCVVGILIYTYGNWYRM